MILSHKIKTSFVLQLVLSKGLYRIINRDKRNNSNAIMMRKLKWFVKKVYICRQFSQKTYKDENTCRVRNIGILAHIDAGKTTTTERMLFYAGKIRSMGEVHHGNTVTDFLEEERERGITISSVAVSFLWKNHQVNMIDTPGHIDFTVEVERTLAVLDGAVIILDASAGVEAQTVTVWRQADRYNLPRIVYLNKMDRPDACPSMCLESLQKKLGAQTLLLQRPLFNKDDKLEGVVDIISLNTLRWKKGHGNEFEVYHLKVEDDRQLWEETVAARDELVENLTAYDNTLAEYVISSESHSVPSELVLQSVRDATSKQKVVPVVCGSSYKNIGVQPLMDAVIKFLPFPDQRNIHIADCFGHNLCARAFKVIHDDQKKPVTYFRIYSGSFTKSQKIYNIQQDKVEQIGKLMTAFADESEEVTQVTNGNIAAVTGLKETMTGDFVTSTAKIADAAKKKLRSFQKQKCMGTEQDFGYPTKIPVPVFFCSVEAPSQAYQSALEVALGHLQREDPSLNVKYNDSTGQTVLGGMGELHLEIIKNRIFSEYKIDIEVGPLQIAYQETPQKLNVQETHVIDNKIGTSQQNVTLTLSVVPRDEKEILLLDRSPESASNIDKLTQRVLTAVEQGVKRAFTRGPKLGYPVVNVSAKLHECQSSRGTSDVTISAAASQCINKILASTGTYLLEPIMELEVVAESQQLSVILADLSRRRAVVHNITDRGLYKVLSTRVPLAELLGYASDLRSISSGTASFTMELGFYQEMSAVNEAEAIKNVTGFYP